MKPINYPRLAGHLQGAIKSLQYDLDIAKAVNYDKVILKLLKDKFDKIIADSEKKAAQD